MAGKPRRVTPDKLRSRLWFDNPDNPGMTALYIERYLNFGLTAQELQSGKPIIGVAQTGSDLSPCNRHHLELAKRVREGIVSAGGVCFEFPTHPIQETGKRPTACLDRNLAYLSLVELLYGYFLDGVVLLTGCDKTMPACLMAAATVNIPAISLNVGPMLNGWSQNERLGSGTVVWKARERHAAGDIDYQQFIDIVAGSAPSVGHCNTMGTASTMNALAEALGMSLPGCAAIPAPYRERGQIAYETGKRIVDMVWEDLKPRDILEAKSFDNAIIALLAMGGSTNAIIHLIAMAGRAGVKLPLDRFNDFSARTPLLANVRPSGERWLMEDFYYAGGLRALLAQLQDLLNLDCRTVNGKTLGENVQDARIYNDDVIRTRKQPLKSSGGLVVLRGSLAPDGAVIKAAAAMPKLLKHIGKAVVFDDYNDMAARIDRDDLDVDADSVLVLRNSGPLGGPGMPEWGMLPVPKKLLKQGVRDMVRISD
ncbi:MAG: dihydroxy-acid dehydratase, partial [Microvirga sp.]